MNVVPDAAARQALAALTATSQPLNGAKLRTFSNNITPSRFSVLADFVESAYGGYPSVLPVITWGAPFTNAQGFAEIDGSMTTYTGDGSGATEPVYGAFVTDASGALLYAERFANPVMMGAVGSGFSYVPRYTAVSQQT